VEEEEVVREAAEEMHQSQEDREDRNGNKEVQVQDVVEVAFKFQPILYFLS
jgi:hypothetical protein